MPEGREDHDLGGIPLVKAELLQGKDKDRRERAIAFLKLVGVREVGRRERIMSLLNARYSPQKASVTCADNAEHMRLFLNYFNDTKDVDLFSGHPIFIDKERKSLGNGSRYYLDSPFAETGLARVFDVLNDPNARRGLWDGYLKVVDGGFLDFARRLGVIDSLPIETCSTWGNPNCHQLRHYGYRTRRTSTETDRDYTIPHLELLLQQKDREVSRCLWMTMSRAPADVLKASYSPNQEAPTHEAPSLLVQNLRRFPWVLCVEGGFHRPEEMTRDSLPDDFPFDNRNGWLDAVEFGKANRQRIEEEKRQRELVTNAEIWRQVGAWNRQLKAEELGVPLEVVDLLDDLTPDQREQAKRGMVEFLKRLKNPPQFPERSAKNPNARAESVAEEAQHAPPKEREVRGRSVRITRQETQKLARDYLRTLYTNKEGMLFCQVCQQVMPFTLDDGFHYFEAVEFIDDYSREHTQNHLALCPVCAAKFQHALGTSSGDFLRGLREAGLRIPVVLAREGCEIRFVDLHMTDLKALFSGKLALASS